MLVRPTDDVVASGERWARIWGASDYEVSDLGRIASNKKGSPRLMQPGRGTSGMRYLRVTLICDDGKKRNPNVHKLVLTAFTGQAAPGLMVLHRDGVVENCKLSNLYWGTPLQNSADRIRHGRSGRGRCNPNATLLPGEVAEIRRLHRENRLPQKVLGKLFGISQVQAGRIVNHRSWNTKEAIQ